MSFLKFELKTLGRILQTIVEKLHCYTPVNFNNLIYSVTSLICQLCFLYICCYLITNIFIFYHQSLPPLCTLVSVLIQASADGITAHYCVEGDWDLGAQWGVTPLSEGRQLVINDNALVMTHGVWESAMMRRPHSVILDRRKKDDTQEIKMDDFHVIHTWFYWFHVTTLARTHDKNDGLSLDVHTTTWSRAPKCQVPRIRTVLQCKVFRFLITVMVN